MQAFHQPLAAASSHPGWHGLLWRCCSLHKGWTQAGGSLSVVELWNGVQHGFKICASFSNACYFPWTARLGSEPGFIHLFSEWALEAWCNRFVLFLPERKNLILEPWTVVWQTESLCISVKVANPQAETTAWDMVFCKFTFMFVDSILNWTAGLVKVKPSLINPLGVGSCD